MDTETWGAQSARIDENIRAIAAFLEERDARRKAGLLVREGPPEDTYVRLDARLMEFQTETRTTLESLRDIVARKADLESLRVATQAQLESLHGDIRIVAEGFANVQAKLDYVAGLVRQYISTG